MIVYRKSNVIKSQKCENYYVEMRKEGREGDRKAGVRNEE